MLSTLVTDGEVHVVNCQRGGAAYLLRLLTLMQASPSQDNLRDQFAMAAMVSDALQSALIAVAYIARRKTFNGAFPGPEENVKEYYKAADAMLKARE
jgi:indole-3-glycerol phosphate synthase